MKIIKIISALCISLLIFISVSLVSFGAGSENLVVDDADILTEQEETELANILIQYSEENQCSIAVLTTNDFEGKDVVTFSDDYYDYNGYGYGENADGLLLVINMETRDWYITTTGYVIEQIPDYSIDILAESFLPSLSSGEYAEAFRIYAEEVNNCLTGSVDYSEDDFIYSDGGFIDSYDDFYGYDDYYGYGGERSLSSVQSLLIAIVIGVVLSFITVSVMKSKLKSVRISQEASEYIKSGSLSVTRTSDRFLYRNVSRTPIPKNNSSSRGGGGGGHIGSSGRSHGGGGGKF